MGNYNDEVCPDVDALVQSCTEGPYHCVVGDREKCRGTYREIIVYDDDQVYPEYVIWYKRQCEGQEPPCEDVLERTIDYAESAVVSNRDAVEANIAPLSNRDMEAAPPQWEQQPASSSAPCWAKRICR